MAKRNEMLERVSTRKLIERLENEKTAYHRWILIDDILFARAADGDVEAEKWYLTACEGAVENG